MSSLFQAYGRWIPFVCDECSICGKESGKILCRFFRFYRHFQVYVMFWFLLAGGIERKTNFLFSLSLPDRFRRYWDWWVPSNSFPGEFCHALSYVLSPTLLFSQSTCHIALDSCRDESSCSSSLQTVIMHCDIDRCNRNACMVSHVVICSEKSYKTQLCVNRLRCRISIATQRMRISASMLHFVCVERRLHGTIHACSQKRNYIRFVHNDHLTQHQRWRQMERFIIRCQHVTLSRICVRRILSVGE